MNYLKKQCRTMYFSLPRFVRYAIPVIAGFTLFLLAERSGQLLGKAIYSIWH